jgi:hypothetical protein
MGKLPWMLLLIMGGGLLVMLIPLSLGGFEKITDTIVGMVRISGYEIKCIFTIHNIGIQTRSFRS